MAPADEGTVQKPDPRHARQVVVYRWRGRCNAHTQEHQFSSRLAEAIEIELRHFPMAGLDVEVITRDFPMSWLPKARCAAPANSRSSRSRPACVKSRDRLL